MLGRMNLRPPPVPLHLGWSPLEALIRGGYDHNAGKPVRVIRHTSDIYPHGNSTITKSEAELRAALRDDPLPVSTLSTRMRCCDRTTRDTLAAYPDLWTQVGSGRWPKYRTKETTP